ncbi:MAG: hypothetical protein DHS20C18_37310 [Saprospiraceae bacterium]|nr:MAG: hypothetical protein DHS20C18_37310 [Saprospiraceae bacterium]
MPGKNMTQSTLQGQAKAFTFYLDVQVDRLKYFFNYLQFKRKSGCLQPYVADRPFFVADTFVAN